MVLLNLLNLLNQNADSVYALTEVLKPYVSTATQSRGFTQINFRQGNVKMQ